jgi:hypothetical protein
MNSPRKLPSGGSSTAVTTGKPAMSDHCFFILVKELKL